MFSHIRAIYEIMWKNLIQQYRTLNFLLNYVLLIYGSLFLSGICVRLRVFWCVATRMSEFELEHRTKITFLSLILTVQYLIICYIPTNCANLLFIFKQHIKTFLLFKLLKLLHVSVTD